MQSHCRILMLGNPKHRDSILVVNKMVEAAFPYIRNALQQITHMKSNMLEVKNKQEGM